MKSKKQLSQTDLILKYYMRKPNTPLSHAEVVDWATAKWKKQTGNVLRDPDRAIRNLHQRGLLIKLSKGVYKYDPDYVLRDDLFEFTIAQKQTILKRDNYSCVVCGRSKAGGFEMQVDHVKPRDKGGLATIENGQTLCGKHNYLKKNYSQTEAGKRFFIKMLEQAKLSNDRQMIQFCNEILELYAKYGYDE